MIEPIQGLGEDLFADEASGGEPEVVEEVVVVEAEEPEPEPEAAQAERFVDEAETSPDETDEGPTIDELLAEEAEAGGSEEAEDLDTVTAEWTLDQDDEPVVAAPSAPLPSFLDEAEAAEAPSDEDLEAAAEHFAGSVRGGRRGTGRRIRDVRRRPDGGSGRRRGRSRTSCRTSARPSRAR